MTKYAELFAYWSSILKPPERYTLSEWAEKHFVLSKYSAVTGPIQLYGWQREIFDAFTDPKVNQIVVASAIQMVKTLLIQAATAYTIAVDPGPILIVQPKEEAARTFSMERLAPMFREMPVLRGKIPDGRREPGNTITFKDFPGGTLSVVGAISADNLARRTIKLLCVDEEDKYEDIRNEGDPWSIGWGRTQQFGSRRKGIRCCSPTVRGRSRIWNAYEQTDRRRPWVACPNCEHLQVLHYWRSEGKLGGVYYDKTLPRYQIPSSARYECEKCGARWNENDRIRAADRAQWKAEQPFVGRAGFWISHLYHVNVSLSELVDLDLQAQASGRAGERQAFINTHLAELWIEDGERPQWEQVRDKRENYRHGADAVVPRRALYLTAQVDIQDDRLEYEVLAWAYGRECWSLEYGVIQEHGPDGSALPSSAPILWERLDAVLKREYQHEAGGKLPIFAMAIDTGHKPKPAYAFARRKARPGYGPAGLKIFQPHTVVLVRGHAGASTQIIHSVSTRDAAKRRSNLPLVEIGTVIAKQEIYDNLRMPAPQKGEAKPGYFHNPSYGDVYFKGLCSENRIVHKDKSVTYEKVENRNEPLDLKVYGVALAEIIDIEHMNAQKLTVFEKMTRPIVDPGDMPIKPPEEMQARPKPTGGVLLQQNRRRVIPSNYL